jgi:hypothetical protein
MTYHVLDAVVLDRDIPEHGLRRGDLGAVVEVYEPDGLEVEFVTASGRILSEPAAVRRERDRTDNYMIHPGTFGRGGSWALALTTKSAGVR